MLDALFTQLEQKDSGFYILVGDRTEIQKECLKRASQYEIHSIQKEQLLMDDVRALTFDLSLRVSSYKKKRIFIINVFLLETVVQNALLKSLEELGSHTSILLIVEHTHTLLGTVLSRAQKITIQKEEGERVPTVTEDGLLFLRTKRQKRSELPFFKKLLQQETKDGRKDRAAVRAFLIAVVMHAQKEIGKRGTKELYLRQMTHALTAISFFQNNTTSIKQIAEYISLILPEIE